MFYLFEIEFKNLQKKEKGMHLIMLKNERVKKRSGHVWDNFLKIRFFLFCFAKIKIKRKLLNGEDNKLLAYII